KAKQINDSLAYESKLEKAYGLLREIMLKQNKLNEDNNSWDKLRSDLAMRYSKYSTRTNSTGVATELSPYKIDGRSDSEKIEAYEKRQDALFPNRDKSAYKS